MKKLSFLSLIHQFYKELKITYKKGKSIPVSFKYLFVYLKQNRVKLDRLSDKTPWMTIPAIKLLQKEIRPETKVFEYGSGASTLFFASYGINVTSIEHDRLWYKRIYETLIKENLQNVSIILKEPIKSNAIEGIYSKKDKRYLNCDFSEYANFILKYENQFFDIIVIDGRVRIACLEVALAKLRKGGLLVFDNGDRLEYQLALSKISSQLLLSNYTVTANSLYFSQTNIYRK